MPHPVKYYSIIFGNRATEVVFCVPVFPQAREHRETQTSSHSREQHEAVKQEAAKSAGYWVRSENPRAARLGGTPHLLQSQAVQKVRGWVFGMTGTASLPKDPVCQRVLLPCTLLCPHPFLYFPAALSYLAASSSPFLCCTTGFTS